MSEGVLVRHEDGVQIVTMSRPEKKNALTHAMYTGLAEALRAGAVDPAVRVLLLTGADGAFTAGNDLHDFLSTPPAGEDAPVLQFLRALMTADKPLVAAVNGLAVGIGLTMLLHCDLVYVARSAKLSAPFVNLGLVPEAASSLLLPQRIGHAKAAALFLLGESLSAEAAVAAGLATEAFEDAVLFPEALQRARLLAAKAPMAVKLTGRLMRGDPAPIAERMGLEFEQFRAQLQSAEAREAFTAFFEKRPPRFAPEA
jgi:enoyl-CoA hydratase/carnithine racemase